MERGLREVDDDEPRKSLTDAEPLSCALTLDHAGDDVSGAVVHVAFSMLTMGVALLVHLDDHDVDVDAKVEHKSSDRTSC